MGDQRFAFKDTVKTGVMFALSAQKKSEQKAARLALDALALWDLLEKSPFVTARFLVLVGAQTNLLINAMVTADVRTDEFKLEHKGI